MTNEADDAVGGAVISGSVAHQNILVRLDETPEEQLLLQQGLETTKVFTAVVVPGNLDIRERDEFEIIAPQDHPCYGDKFRIIGVRRNIFNPRNPNNYIILTMNRSIRAHAAQ